jgi:AAA domain
MSGHQSEMTISQPIVDDLAPLPAEPYPGLRAFEPGEWAIFFGREPMIDEVISRLLNRQIAVVHGSSGCGKSSLIRAGVLPWLQMEHARASVVWKTASMRPAGGPLRNLAQVLAESLGSLPGAASGQAADAWHDRLTLGEWGSAIERQLPGSQRLCLLIDQFEELFRYAREGGREEAQLFVELLCDAAESPLPGLFIVLTMRSDYIGQCAQFEEFAEAVDRCQYLVPRLDNLALLRAIHEPARLFGGGIDAAVADRLLFAARREEDSLPILQHTLMRACRRARVRHGHDKDWTITPEDLAKVEGENGALSTHAEEILGNLGQDNKELIRAAEWVFRSLADIDSEGRIVRRPCRIAQLVEIAGGKTKEAEVTKVIEAFRARECSFLMPLPDEELKPETMVDVGHEALLRQWTRISDPTRDPLTRAPAGWLWSEIEDGQRWRALAVQAQAFMTDPRATLSPATVTAYEHWWPAHTSAWAARYARQPMDAAGEYADMQQLWDASKRGARKDRFWWAVRLGFRAVSAAAILMGCAALLFFGNIAPIVWKTILFSILLGALVYAIASLVAIVRDILKLWSRLRGHLRRDGRGIESHKSSP